MRIVKSKQFINKHLSFKEAKEALLPTYKMSPKTEAIGLKALRDYRAGKLKRFKSIDDLLWLILSPTMNIETTFVLK